MKTIVAALACVVATTTLATPVEICKLSLCTDLVAQYRDIEQQCHSGKLAKGAAVTKKKLTNVNAIYTDFSATLLKHPTDNDLATAARASAAELCGSPITEAE